MVGADGAREIFKYLPTRMAKEELFWGKFPKVLQIKNVDLSKRNERDKN